MNKTIFKRNTLLFVSLVSIGTASLTSCDNYNNENEVKEYTSQIDKIYKEKASKSRYKEYDFVKSIPVKYKKLLKELPKDSRNAKDLFEKYKSDLNRQIKSNSEFRFYYDDQEFYVFDSKEDLKELYSVPSTSSSKTYKWNECNDLANNYYKNYTNMLTSRLLTSNDIKTQLSEHMITNKSSYWLSDSYKKGIHYIVKSDGLTGCINADDYKNSLKPYCIFVPSLSEYNKELEERKESLKKKITEDISKTKSYQDLNGYSFQSTIINEYIEIVNESKTLSSLTSLSKRLGKDVYTGNYLFRLNDRQFRLLKISDDEILAVPEKIDLALSHKVAKTKAKEFSKDYKEISSSSLLTYKQAKELLLNTYTYFNFSYWLDNGPTNEEKKYYCVLSNGTTETKDGNDLSGLLPLCVLKQ